METTTHKTPLREAVNWLKKERIIKRDNDLVDIFKLKKSTISTYLNGKAGLDFLEEFEKYFKISLKKFEGINTTGTKINEVDIKKDTAGITPPERPRDLSAETIRDLARSCAGLSDAVKIMANNNQELIQMQKINSGAAPNIHELIYPYLRKISGVLAEKYHLQFDDVLVELGTLLVEDLLEKKGQGNVDDGHISGK